MISRMYSIEILGSGDQIPRLEASYKGFDGDWDQPAAAIAVVHCQGEIDLWALDDLDHAVTSLKRMYDDDGETIDQLFLFQRVDT